jgi:hypothetical protein
MDKKYPLLSRLVAGLDHPYTVRELIQFLSKQDPDAEVAIGYPYSPSPEEEVFIAVSAGIVDGRVVIWGEGENLTPNESTPDMEDEPV